MQMIPSEVLTLILVAGAILFVVMSFLATFWMHRSSQRLLAQDRTFYLSLVNDARQHYEKSLDNLTDKLISKNAYEYQGIKEVKAKEPERVFARTPNGIVNGGPNGELVTDENTEAAIEIMAQYGVTLDVARKWARDGIPNESNAVLGNVAVE